MGWAGDKTGTVSAGGERGPRQAQVLLYARTAYLCTVPCHGTMCGSESSPRWRAGRPGRPGEEVSGRVLEWSLR